MILEPAMALGAAAATSEATMAFDESADSSDPVRVFDAVAADDAGAATTEQDPWTALEPVDDGMSWRETFETTDAPITHNTVHIADDAFASGDDAVLDSVWDDADAPVLPEVGDPIDRPAMSVFGDTPAVIAAAGAVFDGQAQPEAPSDRY